MNIICAADRNWGIGKDNRLLDHIPEDMKFFRETTKGKAVIMGKNTFLSFPNQKPLLNRLNIVLTHDESFQPEGVTVCKSIEEAVRIAKESYASEDIFFIGGESVYRDSVSLCDKAYVTKIDNEYDADRYLVNFDELPEWTVKSEEMLKTESGLYITFVLYVKSE